MSTDRLRGCQRGVWKYDPSRDIALQTEAVERNPSDPSAYARRAAWHWMKGDRAAAIEDFTHAIALDSTDVRSHRERGRLRELAGDLSGAIVDYTRSIELDPDDPKGYSQRSLARKRSGDLEGSVSDDLKATGLARTKRQERRLSRSQPSSRA